MSHDEDGFNGATASWIADPKVLGGWDKAPIGVPIVPQVSTESSAGIPQETSLTELVRLMMEKGCSPEMILMATALYEKNSQGIPRNSAGKTQAERDFERAEERRRKDRERKELAKSKKQPADGIPRNGSPGIYTSLSFLEENTKKEEKKERIRAREEDFDRFWSAYPKRLGSNPRKPAWDKFQIAVKNGADPEKIISGADGYTAECRKANVIGTQFVKQAAVWLNQQCWNDYQQKTLAASDFNSEEYQAARRRALDAIKGT